jgi:hypothetical protein
MLSDVSGERERERERRRDTETGGDKRLRKAEMGAATGSELLERIHVY